MWFYDYMCLGKLYYYSGKFDIPRIKNGGAMERQKCDHELSLIWWYDVGDVGNNAC